MATTADNLLAGVKRRISMPASQVLLDDDDILSLADGIIRSKIVPIFESTNEEFFVTTTDVALVASTSEYNIPSRAIGRSLRDLKIKDSETDETNVRNLALISIEDIEMMLGASSVNSFYFKGDRVHLVPSVSSSVQTAYLEMWYRIAPSLLTLTANTATVVSTTTTDVTVDAVPSGITTLTPVDFIQGLSGNRIYSTDKTPTAASGTTISFASGDIPTNLTAGDYIALAGYAPVVTMIPDDAYALMESMTCKRCLKAIGDFEGSRELDEDISEERKNLLKILEPRIDGEPRVIINRSGLVRGDKFGQRRWMYGA